MRIMDTPPVLTLQLKRFTHTGEKRNKSVSYPQKLDVSPFMSVPPATEAAKGAQPL